MGGEISLHFSSDERAFRMRMTCRSKSLCRTMARENEKRRRGDKDELRVTPRRSA